MTCVRSNGSSALSLLIEDTIAQEIKVGTSIHTLLEELEPVDMSLQRPIIPLER